jgi:hypothetical protein
VDSTGERNTPRLMEERSHEAETSLKGCIMADRSALVFLGAVCLLVGFSKASHPIWWLDLRRRHPWWDKVDFYAFLYKGRRAEKTVRISGYGLIFIGLFAFISGIHAFLS